MRTRICIGVVAALAPGLALGQGTQIRTGGDSSVGGYLEIKPDAYGGFAQNFNGSVGGPNEELFRPAGSSLQLSAFSAGYFLFVGGTQRELLSDNTEFQGSVTADASLTRSVTSPNVASDSNGDGVNDTLNSAFTVTGGATNLGFNLNQRVSVFSPGVSFLQQRYAVTNNGTGRISFNMVRIYDGDLLWTGDFTTDNVGTATNGSGGPTYVYESEVGSTSQAVTLSSSLPSQYFGGKHGVDPDGAGGSPAYNFGTDVQIWDAFGIPGGWLNHIAGVGYNTNGDSGASPAGSTAPRDAFMGLGHSIVLDAGSSLTFDVFHTYGQTTPVPEPAAVVLLGLGLFAVRRRS
jgi:hypothetical protein